MSTLHCLDHLLQDSDSTLVIPDITLVQVVLDLNGHRALRPLIMYSISDDHHLFWMVAMYFYMHIGFLVASVQTLW